MIDQNSKILVIGLGLMGGSYARVLSGLGYTVWGIDHDPDAIGFALHEQIIKLGSVNPDKELIAQADIIVFGLYPKAMIQWLKNFGYLISQGTLLTDVSGVKQWVVEQLEQVLDPKLQFVPSHPMAGKEVQGVRNSHLVNFSQANFLVTPMKQNTKQAIDTICEFGALLGFAKISVLTPEQHDEMIGFVSQLTHAIAVGLMTCQNIPHLESYTGDSFRDLTRIARINEAMWSELFLLNKQALKQQIDDFVCQLTEIGKCVENEDEQGLREMFAQSTKRREIFDK